MFQYSYEDHFVVTCMCDLLYIFSSLPTVYVRVCVSLSVWVCVQVMEFSDHQGVVQLTCGVHFSLVLTKDGTVFTWSVHIQTYTYMYVCP